MLLREECIMAHSLTSEWVGVGIPKVQIQNYKLHSVSQSELCQMVCLTNKLFSCPYLTHPKTVVVPITVQ